MTSNAFCWDSFPAKDLEGVEKDQKNGNNGEHKRRHEDLPRYNAPIDGNRKPRGAPFNNRNNNGRVPESKHDNRIGHNGNGRGGEQFNNRVQSGPRKQRTHSDSYEDRPKSGPPKGHNNMHNDNRQYRNGTNHRNLNNQNDLKHRNGQGNLKLDKESNNEKELRMQIMRMKGHMLYLKDQNAYKDQVIHHKDQVILALRNKLEKLKEGSSHTAATGEPSTSPVEPPKPADIEEMERDLAGDDHQDVHADNEECHQEASSEDKKHDDESDSKAEVATDGENRDESENPTDSDQQKEACAESESVIEKSDQEKPSEESGESSDKPQEGSEESVSASTENC